MPKQNYLEVFNNASGKITIRTGEGASEMIAIDPDDVSTLIAYINICLQELEDDGEL